MDVNQRPAAEQARSHLEALVQNSMVPGIQYLVVSADRTVFEYAGGWADVAGRRPIDAATTMMAYSMSKTITAAAVLQLVDARTIGLDDPIERYFDSHPYGAGITLRAILSHTTGLPNPIPLAWVHPASRHPTFDERAAFAAVLRNGGHLKSRPGARYRYSNIGYWLLGPTIERATGETFTGYVTDHILHPLGIAPRDLAYVIPDPITHARGYLEKYSWMNLFKRLLVAPDLIGHYESRWLQIRDHYVNGPAFGGLVGTARGFGSFLQDQLGQHSRLFGDRTRDLFYEAQRTNRGAVQAMSLGWHLAAAGRHRFYYKEGGGGGFHSMMRVYRASGVATVVMTNSTGFDVRGLLDRIDPLFLPLERRPR
jgi:D-alanyl-D-alanine carboxypeptidase